MSPGGRRPQPKIDPELRAQLAAAAAGKPRRLEPVEAVLRIRSPVRRSARAPQPSAAQATAREVIERVAGEVGVAAADYDYNVLPNLGYCVLRAPAELVERVLLQPEIASASANRRGSGSG